MEELRQPLSTRKLRTRLAQSILLDLVGQGWQVQFSNGNAAIQAPRTQGESPEQTKKRIRQAHFIDRDLQLQQPAVQAFIRSMEQRRLTEYGWHSIFSLMRDGRELASALEQAERSGTDVPLEAVISPYLQFVEQGAICRYTGLKLNDIWRYFRLTWVNAYRSLPGRTILVLVRDAAGANHPVIGIAALGSSVVQQESRDKWIGWTAHEFVKSLEVRPAAEVREWILRELKALIGEVYLKDLIKDGLLQRKDLQSPSIDVIERLQAEARDARAMHWRNPRAIVHRAHQRSVDGDWKEAAGTSLFRSKRCEALARLLTIRLALSEHVRAKEEEDLSAMLSSAPARVALAQLVRLVKAQRVGIDMMDITVCGAVAPYNALLGGKLVCMLLASHEVVEYHQKKYETQASVIASSIKGEAVRRPPRLVLLGTTSLYGVGSSQYNRVKVPCAEVRGRADEALEYKRLGLSKGYGSFHFSGMTIGLIDVLLSRRDGGRRVNSLFGEGVNPLLRKIREALDYLQLHSDSILNHGNPRVVYGVALARNFREVLLGFEEVPDYLLPPESPQRTTQLLGSYWRRRWLAPRAKKPEFLEDVRKHTLTYPVQHGARVGLQPSNGQGELNF
ncbi:MAG TPA: Druantia anti-phage system protein DruA [Thermoanaerobaculia bacterium]|nr:Druantia anti-phage system protein DruA [Thermoanaerobaculia bacterium]